MFVPVRVYFTDFTCYSFRHERERRIYGTHGFRWSASHSQSARPAGRRWGRVLLRQLQVLNHSHVNRLIYLSRETAEEQHHALGSVLSWSPGSCSWGSGPADAASPIMELSEEVEMCSGFSHFSPANPEASVSDPERPAQERHFLSQTPLRILPLFPELH